MANSSFASDHPDETTGMQNATTIGTSSQASTPESYIPPSDRIAHPDAPSGYRSQAGMGVDEVPITAQNRNVAAVLALLFGAWGLHLFYLKYYKQGLAMIGITLLVTIFTLGAGLSIPAAYGVIMGIRYLSKDKRTWYSYYVLDRSNAWW